MHRRRNPIESNLLFPCEVEFIPLLIRCYEGTSSPVWAQFIAGSLAGERGFSDVSHPCGFRMRSGARPSASVKIR